MSEKVLSVGAKAGASLSQAKMLGAMGSVLVVLTSVPSIGGYLGVIGGILILLAVKEISDTLADGSIFKNILIATFSGIAGVAVAVLAVLGYLISFFGSNNLLSPYYWSSFNPAVIPVGEWIGLFASVFIGLIIVWAALTVSAVFVRRSFSAISSKLNVGLFSTAGLVYLIGAATTIVFVGFPIIFVAEILLIVAFLSMKDTVPASLSESTQSLPRA